MKPMIIAILIDFKESVEDVACWGIDDDTILAIGEGRDVDGVVVAIDLGGNHSCG